ncbi:S-adenosyl methyltransferase [Labedaea rhizosphaerae]|uniref:S-adenosyl methyltransferase n=2 Tax=Labedaea rhizosphaerae TaxID=598644 RepID=A0A4R6SGK0_LABRH|nr:S-adenosyl methyltransferase [Labedaea rhizosphaerae]
MDLESACTARIDDYVAGGTSNLAVDRAAAERLLTALPEYPGFVVDSRRYALWAVDAMLSAGIDQFIDIGAGIDAVGVVDKLASWPESAARIAYVETDPMCVAQLESRVHKDERVAVFPIDLFAPSWVTDPEGVWRLLAADRPVGLLMASIAHYELSDDVLASALTDIYDKVAAGSMLAITHLSGGQDPIAATRLEQAHTQAGFPVRARNRKELAALVRPWTPAPWAPNALPGALRLGIGLLARKAAPPSSSASS